MNKLLIFPVFFMLLISCSDDDAIDPNASKNEIEPGSVLVVNEGNFGQANGSLSLLHKERPDVEQDVLAKANDGILTGDVVQSAYRHQGKLYVVINADSKILVLDENTFIQTDVIENELSNPRYMLIEDDEIFVTNWNSDFENSFVSVFDLNSLNHIRNIDTDAGTEKIHFDGINIWVSNNFSNTIQVFSSDDSEVQQTISTAFAPNNLCEVNELIYVLCQGEFGATGAIIKYDKNTFDSLEGFNLPFRPIGSFHIGENERIFVSNGSTMYTAQFKNASVITSYEMQYSVKAFESIYSFEMSPAGYLWMADTKSFTENGRVYRYGTTGSFQRSWEVGIGPNSMVFY